MSQDGRCIVCDGFPKKVNWDDEAKGYVCTDCEEATREALNDFGEETEDLGGLEDLVGRYPDGETPEEIRRRDQGDAASASELAAWLQTFSRDSS